jgi:parallel beta-helix repeat protein
MTKIRQSKIYLLVLLVVLLTLISPFFDSDSFQTEINETFAPKSSGFWIMDPIHIEAITGSGLAYTWNEAVLEPWCSGNGTLLDPFVLENITIDAGGNETALTVENSNGLYFTIRNCTLKNAGTNLMGNSGIKLISSSNGTIENNFCLNNIKYGIFLQDGSYYNIVRNNYIYNSSHGGIRFDLSNHNNVTNNEIIMGGAMFSVGIYISTSSSQNRIFHNNISDYRDGIEIFSSCNNNTISNSFINSITDDGIIINPGANNNSFTMNKINNTNEGIRMMGDGSLVYKNYMTNNGQNAIDNGNYNRWDNESIGNYWDDYADVDVDDDGIGDSPYSLPGTAGTHDNFPIWDDGPEPIYINGAATGVGAKNWSWAVNQPWCTGLGTFISPFVIEGISRDGRGNGFCISVENSDVYFEVRNCNFSNAGFTFPDAAILLNNVAKATLSGNDLTDNNFVGVLMDNSDYNFIVGNNISLVDLGIGMTNSEFNQIIGNTINDNLENAINIDDNSHNNTISGNTAINNQLGISIFSNSHNNTVIGNTVMKNNWAGISFISNCDGNYAFNNIISDNNIGLTIPTSDSQYNTIYNNTFTLNTLNANDDSLKNDWNFGTLGNYWDNYTGTDLDDNGIGDIPYNVSGAAGSKDYYPIWDDGDDTNPTISINTPSGGSLFGIDAPSYNLNIFDLNLNKSWYTLNSTATRYFFTPTNGVNVVAIDETGWDSFSSGSILMTFYVNDSAGNPASISNLILKDAILPILIVNSPLGGAAFDLDAPEFNLTIYDSNLLDAWYTVGTSVTQYSFSPINGNNIVAIDESSWDALPEGSVTINFFVNDDAGNVRTIPVIVNKELPPEEPPVTPGIPFGQYYLVFIGIAILALLITQLKRRKYRFNINF